MNIEEIRRRSLEYAKGSGERASSPKISPRTPQKSPRRSKISREKYFRKWFAWSLGEDDRRL